jgi:hypothetical protein
MIHHYADNPESFANGKGSGKEGSDLLGIGIGGNIDLFERPIQKQVAYSPTNEPGFKSGPAQGVYDTFRV